MKLKKREYLLDGENLGRSKRSMQCSLQIEEEIFFPEDLNVAFRKFHATPKWCLQHIVPAVA